MRLECPSNGLTIVRTGADEKGAGKTTYQLLLIVNVAIAEPAGQHSPTCEVGSTSATRIPSRAALTAAMIPLGVAP